MFSNRNKDGGGGGEQAPQGESQGGAPGTNQ
jgi:hypothetical protein